MRDNCCAHERTPSAAGPLYVCIKCIIECRFKPIEPESRDLIKCSILLECLYQKSTIWTCLLLFTVCGSVLSGHAAPSAEAAGDKATDAATQEGNMLVMSGGEGYIDFRMGEFATCDGGNIIVSTTADLEI